MKKANKYLRKKVLTLWAPWKCPGDPQGLWSTLRTSDLINRSRQWLSERQPDVCFLLTAHTTTKKAFLSKIQFNLTKPIHLTTSSRHIQGTETCKMTPKGNNQQDRSNQFTRLIADIFILVYHNLVCFLLTMIFLCFFFSLSCLLLSWKALVYSLSLFLCFFENHSCSFYSFKFLSHTHLHLYFPNKDFFLNKTRTLSL